VAFLGVVGICKLLAVLAWCKCSSNEQDRERVFADEPFSLEALGDFLGAATQINVDAERIGDGPVDGCLVLQRADYTTLREVSRSASR
jgi:hypothetical protein